MSKQRETEEEGFAQSKAGFRGGKRYQVLR